MAATKKKQPIVNDTDSIDENRHYIEVGDDYYSTIKYFYAINGPKYEII